MKKIPLHPFDVMGDYLDHNGIKYWKSYWCGCMTMHIQKKREEAVFANWFSDNLANNNKFDISLKQKQPPKEDFSDDMEGLTRVLADAEDKYLVHLAYNFKKGGDGAHNYSEFMCNCHLNWCIEHGPRNMYWNQQVIGEAPGTTASPIQRGLYEVKVIPGACNGCQACFNTDPLKEEGGESVQVLFCPAGAISKVADEGIAIDTDRCLGCLHCVRNCFRIKQSNDIALTVTPLPEPDDPYKRIPETHKDMDEVREKNVLNYEWVKFRYDVE